MRYQLRLVWDGIKAVNVQFALSLSDLVGCTRIFVSAVCVSNDLFFYSRRINSFRRVRRRLGGPPSVFWTGRLDRVPA